ncbi:related to RRP7 - essential protein involved in rRNA processing and ribosome biogenesis [Ustilago trichophora]|uniref:Related to RRP7 - essential protein involved in rRNA processing and ribosome biogenesis n=1 Tax=Ustilago trichophora TaxID=86804 RepID=A0A5C3E8H2_9BASI|nr:related to RRP7 - essential protein involved in rRNA processing and ribosome biogenesis [Ustilago trichophora]
MGKAKKSSESLASISSSSKKSSHDTCITLSNGFLAVPLSISNSNLGQEVKHWIYVRKHTGGGAAAGGAGGGGGASKVASTSKAGREEELPTDRTLFVANLPVDTTESHIREMFGKVGNVSSVKFRRGVTVDEREEEDEIEQMGEGEDEDQEEEEVMDGAAGGHQQVSGKKARKSATQSKKSRVPRIVPLPSLDPREAMGSQAFLTTSSSAHVVFLDTTSFSRAFDLLSNQTGLKWIDPFKALRREAAKQAASLSSSSSSSSSSPAPSRTTTTTSASFLLKSGGTIPPYGLSFLLDQYALSRPSLPTIQTWANSTISLYTYRKAHPLPRRIGVRGVTVGPSGELLDQDGFIIVQRSTTSNNKYGRVGAAADSGGSVGIAKHGFQENQRKKSTALQDFYRFQLREKKREQLADLRAKFEADKAKVAQMKASRRFKPY